MFDVAAVDATARFCGILRMVDAQTRRVGRGEPLSEEAQRIEEEFWRLLDVLDAEIDASRSNPLVRERVRSLGPMAPEESILAPGPVQGSGTG